MNGKRGSIHAGVLLLLLLVTALSISIIALGNKTTIENQAAEVANDAAWNPWKKALQFVSEDYPAKLGSIAVDSPQVTSSSFTAEGWIYPNWNISNGNYTILSRDDQALNVVYDYYYSSPVLDVDFVTDGPDATSFRTDLPNDVNKQTPHHIAVQYDYHPESNTGVFSLYVDGTKIGSENMTGKPAFKKNMLRLGANTNLGAHWQGSMDEFRFSNIARYNQSFEVAKIPFQSDPNTLVLYHFDGPLNCESSGNNCYLDDSSGSKIPGKIVGKVSLGESDVPTTGLSNRLTNWTFDNKLTGWKTKNTDANDKVVAITGQFYTENVFHFSRSVTGKKETLSQTVIPQTPITANSCVAFVVWSNAHQGRKPGANVGAVLKTFGDGKTTSYGIEINPKPGVWEENVLTVSPKHIVDRIKVVLYNTDTDDKFFFDAAQLYVIPSTCATGQTSNKSLSQDEIDILTN